MDTLKFTPTEQKILAVLADGLPHHKTELKRAIDPETPDMIDSNVLSMHITRIKTKLEKIGETVVCRSIIGRRLAYQHVRLLCSPYDGRT